VDLSTSDVEGSRTFYSELFGWEAGEPNTEFGGYFMFMRDGLPIAGGMGDMGGEKANDAWTTYLTTDDVGRTIREAESAGAHVVVPAVPIADMGTQAILVDPSGATVGLWQAGTFPGFVVLAEHGAPSWFELHSRAYADSVEFYRTVFRPDMTLVGDSDEFRYSTMDDPNGGGEFAGIMDAVSFLPEGMPSYWALYWEVDDVDASIATLERLGGSVVRPAEATPYGKIATVTDPSGAEFRLRTAPT
jgi:hypothetical protein